MTNEIQHCILPPSSAARRIACPGSRELEASFPQEDTEEARAGEAAHWVAMQYLNIPAIKSMIPDTFAPNMETITEEMIEGAELYRDTIVEILNKWQKPREILHVEEKLGIPNIAPECWGTPDCWAVNIKSKEIYIFDYKFGHRFVEVEENWQLIEYCAGILHRLELKDESEYTVHFAIIQPRCYQGGEGSVRWWQTTVAELYDYFDKLIAAENKAMEPKAPTITSDECRDCKGRFVCNALRESALNIVETTSTNIPHQLHPKELGPLLKYLTTGKKRLDALITGLQAQALSYINEGKRIPFFIREETNSRQIWNVPSEEVLALAEVLGVEGLAKPVQLITPKQAIKAGLPEELVNSMSITPRGKEQLKEENPSKFKKHFKES